MKLDQILTVSPAPDLGKPTEGFRNWIQMPIECADGTTISVQASRGHYCTPRGDAAPYSEVEVGYPSADPGPDWLPYKDNPSSPDFSDVYAYVPVELVHAFITAHGGEKQAA